LHAAERPARGDCLRLRVRAKERWLDEEVIPFATAVVDHARRIISREFTRAAPLPSGAQV